MKSTNHLHALISRIGKREKEFFIKFCGLQSGPNEGRYLKLFKILSQQKNYDATGARRELRVNRKQYAATKNYLQNQLLASLRLIHTHANDERKALDFLEDAEILIQKGVKELALSRLKSLNKTNDETLRASVESKIYELEVSLGKSKSGGLNEAIKMIEKQASNLKAGKEADYLLSSYQALLERLNATYWKGEKISEDNVEALNHLNAEVLRLKQDAVGEVVFATQCMVNLLENRGMNVDVIINGIRSYGAKKWNGEATHRTIGESYWWLIDSLLAAKEITSAKAVTKELEKLCVANRSIRKAYSIPLHVFELEKALETGTKEDRNLVVGLSRKLKGKNNYGSIGTSAMRVELFHRLALLQFVDGNYEKALNAIDQTNRAASLDAMPEQKGVALGILELMSLFEVKKYNQIKAKPRALVLFIQKCKRLHEHELILINCMRRVQLFPSLHMERRFYKETLRNVNRSACRNRDLLVQGKPVTVMWLEHRLGHCV